jgi:hypothetical protein
MAKTHLGAKPLSKVMAKNLQMGITFGKGNGQMPQKSKTIGDRNAKKGIGFGKNGYLM